MTLSQLLNPLLKQREDTISGILNKKEGNIKAWPLFLSSLVMYALYGAIIGASQSPLQALSSALKLPLLFYFTAIICFPTLFFFLSFLGARHELKQLFTFIVLCNTYISLVLTAFAPVAFFFLIAGYSYPLFKFLNILIFMAAGFTGVYLFYKEMNKIIYSLDPEGIKYEKTRNGKLFLKGWALLYAFIGLQLSFTLSPFFGYPGNDFLFITPESSNFFSNMLETIAALFIHK